jgi:antitoxin component YwqK of YwqJK toxin-antitoxin module
MQANRAVAQGGGPKARRGAWHFAWLLGETLPALALAAVVASAAEPALQKREIRSADGRIESQWQVKIGEEGQEIRHGRFLRLHPNGHPALEAWYRDGERVGVWNWWDEQGNLLRSTEFEYGVAVPLRGEALSRPTYAFTLLSGRKSAEGLLKGDRPHGRWQFWHINGQPRAEGDYLTGIPNGRWQYFYEDGQLERLAHYDLGILHGEFREAYPNGQERRRGRIDQGLKTGTWRFWYPDGRLRAEGAFQGDLQEGEWRYWDENGVLTRRVLYHAGTVVQDLEIPAGERSRIQPAITTEDDLLPPPILVDELGNLIRPEER